MAPRSFRLPRPMGQGRRPSNGMTTRTMEPNNKSEPVNKRTKTALEDYHQVITVDDLVIGDCSQRFGYLLGAQSENPMSVLSAVVREAAGELDAVAIAQRDHVALVERTLHLHDADGQETATFFLHGAAGAGVDKKLPFRPGGISQPAFPGRDGRPVRQEERTHGFGSKDGIEDAGARAIGHDHRFAGGGGEAGRTQLAAHAARAQAAAAAPG